MNEKVSVCTPQGRGSLSILEKSWQILVRQIIGVRCDIHTEYINKMYEGEADIVNAGLGGKFITGLVW